VIKPLHGIEHDGLVVVRQGIDYLFLVRRQETFALRDADDGESRFKFPLDRLGEQSFEHDLQGRHLFDLAALVHGD
jgi:hypothetical protein